MEFQEFGKDDGKTLLLLPGTSCIWELNFAKMLNRLKETYRLICVNYDGFCGDESTFPDMLTETAKIEEYLIEKHGGKIDGAYGSSLGGSFVGLLIQRKKIHIDHGFIGSSDLDQTGPFLGKLEGRIISNILYSASKSEKGRKRLMSSIKKAMNMEESGEMLKFLDDYAGSFAGLSKESIYNQFYSDLITPLDDKIDVPGTVIHVIYALKMGEKYEKRYLQHFKNPDIRRLDMQHEGWMFDPAWAGPVMDIVDECMAG